MLKTSRTERTADWDKSNIEPLLTSQINGANKSLIDNRTKLNHINFNKLSEK